MPVPEYRYGKVSGLLPDLTVVSERSESPMVCCGYCSAHMACMTARSGLSALMKNEAHAIRAAGGRPHNAGNTASELRVGASKALGVTLQDVSIADIPARLRAGFAVTVGLQYGQLPAWLKVQTNDFGHAVCLFGWKPDDHVGFFDPLWTQGSAGAWVPWSAVTNAMWPNRNHSTTVEKIGGGDVSGIYWNPSRWKAGKDITVYADPSFTKAITTIKQGSLFSSLGPKGVVDADGKDTTTWSVLVNTGGFIPGGTDPAHPYVAWMKKADMPASAESTSEDWDDSIWNLALDPSGRYPCPPPATVPPPIDNEAEIAAAVALRDEEWEKALTNGEPWPTA